MPPTPRSRRPRNTSPTSSTPPAPRACPRASPSRTGRSPGSSRARTTPSSGRVTPTCSSRPCPSTPRCWNCGERCSTAAPWCCRRPDCPSPTGSRPRCSATASRRCSSSHRNCTSRSSSFPRNWPAPGSCSWVATCCHPPARPVCCLTWRAHASSTSTGRPSAPSSRPASPSRRPTPSGPPSPSAARSPTPGPTYWTRTSHPCPSGSPDSCGSAATAWPASTSTVPNSTANASCPTPSGRREAACTAPATSHAGCPTATWNS